MPWELEIQALIMSGPANASHCEAQECLTAGFRMRDNAKLASIATPNNLDESFGSVQILLFVVLTTCGSSCCCSGNDDTYRVGRDTVVNIHRCV